VIENERDGFEETVLGRKREYGLFDSSLQRVVMLRCGMSIAEV